MEQVLSTFGLAIRRNGNLITAGSETPPAMNTCSALVDLVVRAPRSKRKKYVKKMLRIDSYTAEGRRDRDAIVLKCVRSGPTSAGAFM